MKNYDELTQELLRRRDQYFIAQKKKRKRIVAVVAPVVCMALVIMLGYFMRPEAFAETADSPVSLQEQDTRMPTESQIGGFTEQTVLSPELENVIIVNTGDSQVSADMAIALMWDDFIAFSHKEAEAYYGVDLTPVVPEDLALIENANLGLYKRNGGTGEIYWDQNIILYANPQTGRNVSLGVSKDKMPRYDVIFHDPDPQSSTINGHSFVIGLIDETMYYTEFMYHNVGFTVCAEGLNLDEFVAVLSSLVQ